MWRIMLLVVIACTTLMPVVADEPLRLQGTCMGTTYAVTIADRLQIASLKSIDEQVSNELERIEQIFSLYRPSSELSRLNTSKSTDWISVSSDLLAIAKRAVELAGQSDGAFDPTIAPLMRLWRLQQVTADWSPPSAMAIAETRKHVGFHHVEIRTDPPAIRKRTAGIELDLNALVEGGAIDRVIDLLQKSKVKNALVELGGEFRAIGHKPNEQPWKIGLESPLDTSALYATTDISSAALATSGNYRQSIEYHGRRYGHILDARTGEPIRHNLVAVSVIANDALTADGWATAFMALGPTEGFELAEKNGLVASFALREGAMLQVKLTKAAISRIALLDK